MIDICRTEKNATPWSKQRLSELLVDQKLEKGCFVLTFNRMKKIEGEATANNRKAKLIFLFEWVIELGFEGLSFMTFNGVTVARVFFWT